MKFFNYLLNNLKNPVKIILCIFVVFILNFFTPYQGILDVLIGIFFGMLGITTGDVLSKVEKVKVSVVGFSINGEILNDGGLTAKQLEHNIYKELYENNHEKQIEELLVVKKIDYIKNDIKNNVLKNTGLTVDVHRTVIEIKKISDGSTIVIELCHDIKMDAQ